MQELKNSGVGSGDPAQLARRVHRPRQSGPQPGLHADLAGAWRHERVDVVTTFGCPAVDTGEFFSPTPGLDVIDQLDPDFNPVYAGIRRRSGRLLHRAPAVVAEQGTRADARGHRSRARPGGVHEHARDHTVVRQRVSYAPVEFTVDDHFGGTGAHLLDADCTLEPKQFTTAEQFVSARASGARTVAEACGLLIGLGLAVVPIAGVVPRGREAGARDRQYSDLARPTAWS